MAKGHGGTGSRKFGRRCASSSKQKFDAAREANEEIRRREETERNKNAGPKFGTILELMGSRKKKR